MILSLDVRFVFEEQQLMSAPFTDRQAAASD